MTRFNSYLLFWFLIVLFSAGFMSLGLHGPFLLDDFGNLASLSKINDLSGYHWYNFIFEFSDSGSGRPVSMATFILNYSAWPSSPFYFKVTNLVIHLLNSLLVAWLCVRFVKLTDGSDHKWLVIVPFLVVLMWLVQPIQHSTVFYVIQRMAQLSTFFALLGCILYTYFRVGLFNPKACSPHRWLLYALFFGLFLTLGVFSKENGLLLAVYVLVIEFTLFSDQSRPLALKVWLSLLTILPLVLFTLFIASKWEAMIGQGYVYRSFSLPERLMSQVVILVDYLRQIVLPRTSGAGLFYDAYPVVKSVVEPRFVFSSFVLGGLLYTAFSFRKISPLFSLGIFLFFASHLIESTFIPLELYFEHRNYFGSFGVYLALFASLKYVYERSRPLTFISVCVYFGLVLIVSYQNMLVWSDSDKIATVWAAENPNSIRARQLEANYWLVNNRVDLSRESFRSVSGSNPKNIVSRLQSAQMSCLMGEFSRREMLSVFEVAPHGDFDLAIFGTIRKLDGYIDKGICSGLERNNFLLLLSLLEKNPKFQKVKSRANIYYARGVISSKMGNLDDAMVNVENAFELDPHVNKRLLQAGWLASAGLYSDALDYVAKAKALSDSLKPGRYRYRDEISEFEQQIKIEMKK